MKIINELKEIPLPAVYNREGKECYYDTFRKKLIQITPEETVRQKIAKLFEIKYGVPKEMISLEVPVSYYARGLAGRADIVIHAYDEEIDCKYPVTIVECKNEDVLLTDKVADQAMRYCDIVGGKYIVITNGVEIGMAVYNEESKEYVFLDALLSYEKMVDEDYAIPNFMGKKFIRFTIDELNNQETLTKYNEQGNWLFGADSIPKVRTFAVNFYQAMLDVEHTLPPKKLNTVEVLEDIGLRYMDYGNAGGGHYAGIYRAFLVNDRFKESQIVSVSIFGTDSDFRGENRSSYTSLVVSIDRFKISHNSLQYNVDRYANIHADGKVEFIHNGQIGSFKSSDVIDKVRQYGDGLKVTKSGIEIGMIDCSKLLYLDDRETSELMYNLIEYALLREEVRRDKRK